ncbi:putative cell surface spherulin 4-like protein [Metarhizium anisopliae]
MRFTASVAIALTTSLAALVSSTGIILPLYLYPSITWNDGAANWSPAFNAIAAHPSLPWLAVVNVATGPGSTYMPGNNDVNYIAGVSKLNSFPNVKTLGYIRTAYASIPMDEITKNITAWANWASYSASNISIHGLFIDESSNLAYMTNVTSFARKAFSGNITIFCHFGAAAPADFYKICDAVGSFESYASYLSTATMKNTIPAGYEKQAGIIIHDFVGKTADGIAADTNSLNSYIQGMVKGGLGWLYFCTGYFNSMSTGPATVGQVAQYLASDTLLAVGSTGTSAQWTVPQCAQTMRFNITGGAGGQIGYQGGYGALISGSISVSPGQTISAVAGSAGGINTAGMSAYGNGGTASQGGGGGGAASALYLGGILVAVAGGGGGGSITVGTYPNGKAYQSDSNRGNGETPGVSRVITPTGANMANYFSKAAGGSPGSASSPGVGGQYYGYATTAYVGRPGSGTAGGAGVGNPQTTSSGAGGSGGGGGGYKGGGGGASVYWNYGDGWYVIPAGGAGGSSYVSGSVSGVSQGIAASSGGSVVVTYRTPSGSECVH